jgi:hypothetical protein
MYILCTFVHVQTCTNIQTGSYKAERYRQIVISYMHLYTFSKLSPRKESNVLKRASAQTL